MEQLSNELTGKRMRASGLAQSDADIISVVRNLGAVQAQLLFGAQMALMNRTKQGPSEIADRLDSGDLVISWLNRGTLHMVIREDFWTFQELTAPSRIRTLAARFKTFGVDQSHQEKVLSRLDDVLSATPAIKDELLPLMDISKVKIADNMRGIVAASFLELASAHGLLVRGPKLGSEPTYVSAEAWVGPKAQSSDDLSSIAVRYSRSHYGSTAEDFAGWLGIGLRDARAVWREPGAESGPISWTGLLGPFDPLLHGWKDRSWLLGEHVNKVISTNGVFRPSIIVENKCVGLWKYTAGKIELDYFAKLAGEHEEVIRQQSLTLMKQLNSTEDSA